MTRQFTKVKNHKAIRAGLGSSYMNFHFGIASSIFIMNKKTS